MTHLLGFRFAPRIRDLGDKRIYSIEKPETYPGLAPLLGGTINVKQIEGPWGDLLRLTSSLRIKNSDRIAHLGKARLLSSAKQPGMGAAGGGTD